MSTEQINILVNKIGFQSQSNIDENTPSRPGTAVIWRNGFPIENVINIVLCRVQAIVIGSFVFFNVYAPSGADRRRERETFFQQ